MRVHELGHVVLYVRDLARSIRFYRDVLGFSSVVPDDVELPFPAMAFSSGRTHHELLLIEVGPTAAALPPGRRVGLYHLGLKIGDTDDELRDALQTLHAHQIVINGASDHGMTHSLYIEDPDGHEIELYIDVAGVDWSDPDWWTKAPRARALVL